MSEPRKEQGETSKKIKSKYFSAQQENLNQVKPFLSNGRQNLYKVANKKQVRINLLDEIANFENPYLLPT